ncbi:MAG: biotin--[acetyl-CoA-carboxylase] ligase [Bacteroidota bacterium]
MFDQTIFEQKLATSWLGRSLCYFEETTSTNSVAKTISLREEGHGSIVLADAQSQGRGQYKRTWVADPGENLTFSIILTPERSHSLIVLTLACAYAIRSCFEERTQYHATVKWPNDVLVNDKKVAGLLTETVFKGNKLDRAIIGIGINVNQADFGEELNGWAGSLRQLTGHTNPREELLADLLLRIEHCYTKWLQHDVELVKLINSTLIGFGDWVTIEKDGERLAGTFKFLGINQTGALTVLDQDMELNTFLYEQIRIHPISADSQRKH